LNPIVAIEGDTSGAIGGVARVVAGPEDLVPISQKCAGAGLTQAQIQILTFDSPLGISSPQS
jgi:hypothetical protein